MEVSGSEDEAGEQEEIVVPRQRAKQVRYKVARVEIKVADCPLDQSGGCEEEGPAKCKGIEAHDHEGAWGCVTIEAN